MKKDLWAIGLGTIPFFLAAAFSKGIFRAMEWPVLSIEQRFVVWLPVLVAFVMFQIIWDVIHRE